MLIAPRARPVGAGRVDRVLPHRSRRMVGPFTFLDVIGPDPLPARTGVDVPVHPHIGLATVTYLSSGALVHRDSTGAVQRIDPGDVNWMHAGGGVTHSERSPDDERAADSTVAGVQFWVALPDHAEDDDPFFEHHPRETLPKIDLAGVEGRLLAGAVDDVEAPPSAASRLLLVAADLDGSRPMPVPDAAERAVLVLDGDVRVGGTVVSPHHLAVLDDDRGLVTVESAGAARVLVLGGEPVGARQIWWNFVASTPDRIEDAKRRWQAGEFALVPDDPELVPLPAS